MLSIKNQGDRLFFLKYDTSSIGINDFNVLVDGKSFFDAPIKNKEEAYEKIIKMRRNNDYTTVNLLNYEYFQIIAD